MILHQTTNQTSRLSLLPRMKFDARERVWWNVNGDLDLCRCVVLLYRTVLISYFLLAYSALEFIHAQYIGHYALILQTYAQNFSSITGFQFLDEVATRS